MKRIIRFLKVAILTLFGASTILLVGAVHFSATGIIQSPDFLEPAYKGNGYPRKLNPKSDNLRPSGNGFRDVNYPEVIQLVTDGIILIQFQRSNSQPFPTV